METLGNQPDSQMGGALSAMSSSDNPPLYKVGDTRSPTLIEVMLDSEFLQELRGGNPELLGFLDAEKLLALADYVIHEPKFSDSAERCF